MLLTTSTVPATAGTPRTIDWRPIVAAFLIVVAAVAIFLAVSSTAPTTTLTDVDEAPALSEDEMTRRLVNEGYLPAQVLEPAG